MGTLSSFFSLKRGTIVKKSELHFYHTDLPLTDVVLRGLKAYIHTNIYVYVSIHVSVCMIYIYI